MSLGEKMRTLGRADQEVEYPSVKDSHWDSYIADVCREIRGFLEGEKKYFIAKGTIAKGTIAYFNPVNNSNLEVMDGLVFMGVKIFHQKGKSIYLNPKSCLVLDWSKD
jgi:hypothetical protein